MQKLLGTSVLFILVLALFINSPSAQAGLIHHYTFDGNANDQVGSNHGVLRGDSTFAAGVVGQAVSFDGNSDYVLLDQTMLQTANWTMTGYFNFANTTQRHSIYGEYSYPSNADTDNYMVYVDDQGGLLYDNYPNGGNAVTSMQVTAGEWHSFAYVRDGGTMRIYLDGALVGTGAYETYFGSASVFGAFGARLQAYDDVYTTSDPTKYSMNGMLDDIRVYDHSLTDAQLVPTPTTFGIFFLGILGLFSCTHGFFRFKESGAECSAG